MKSLERFFQDCSEIIDKKLDELIPGENIEPVRLHKAVRWSLFAGGKRFRPALVFAAGEVFNIEQKKLLRTAAAVEMIHTYSLIHDDLPAMDNDDLRRGRATCHKKFDEATAILAGDVLQSFAFQAIADDKTLSSEIRIKLIYELAKAAGSPAGMVAGQQMDSDAEKRRISDGELERIHQSKTGAMIGISAKAAAIIAEADEKQLKAVTDYALNLGLLFQITDDLLDVTQTTETLGKTAGKDLTAEKATYPAVYGLEKAQNLAEATCRQAVESLKRLPHDTQLLEDLAKSVLLRQK